MIEMYVPQTKIRYRNGENGGETTYDNGATWNFTFRSPSEWREMFPSAVIISDSSMKDIQEREIFGETLDEPIPDDLWEMIV